MNENVNNNYPHANNSRQPTDAQNDGGKQGGDGESAVVLAHLDDRAEVFRPGFG